MNLKLTESERTLLIQTLTATVEQLDQVMVQGMSAGNGYEDMREVADASNGLADILDKLNKGSK